MTARSKPAAGNFKAQERNAAFAVSAYHQPSQTINYCLQSTPLYISAMCFPCRVKNLHQIAPRVTYILALALRACYPTFSRSPQAPLPCGRVEYVNSITE